MDDNVEHIRPHPVLRGLANALGVPEADLARHAYGASTGKQPLAALVPRICKAYEAGYVQGLGDDQAPNPHPAGVVGHEAWAFGLAAGRRAFGAVGEEE